MMIAYRAGLYDRTTLKTGGMKLMVGKVGIATLQDVGREFADRRVADDGLMPATLALLEEDRRQVLQTSSPPVGRGGGGGQDGLDAEVAERLTEMEQRLARMEAMLTRLLQG